MRFLFLFFLVSTSAFGQKSDSLTGPVNVIDGVYIPIDPPCKYDTIVRLHSNAAFAIADSNFLTYTFKPGTKTYLEISIQTRECHCSDCGSSNKLIIDLSEIPDSGEMALSPENLMWISGGSWSRPKTEQHIDGKITLKGDAVSLQAFSYYDTLHRAVLNSMEVAMKIKQP